MIIKIISGGQTGVDQGALDFALNNGFDCGGSCPKGRLSEDGVIPFKYPVKEIETKSYPKRTEQNVRDSDGTLILFRGSLTGKGTLLTIELCKQHGKPHFILNLAEHQAHKGAFQFWLESNKIKTLNVAGGRESNNIGIQQETYNALFNLFGL